MSKVKGCLPVEYITTWAMLLYLLPSNTYIYKILATVKSAKMVSCTKDFSASSVFLYLSSELTFSEWILQKVLISITCNPEKKVSRRTKN
jgi:hypothetical protein